MKILSKITCAIAALGLVVALSSCGKDTCYECPSFEEGGITYDALDLCEDDYAGSKTALELAVSGFESTGYDCSKK